MPGYIDIFEERRTKQLELHNRKIERRGLEDPYSWSWYMSDHRLFAIAAYVLDRNVEGYFDHLKQMLHWQFKLLDNSGKEGFENYITYVLYKEMMNTLVYGDPKACLKTAQYMGKVDLEKERPPIQIKALHLGLRLLLLGKGATRKDLDEMETLVLKKKKSMVGFIQCFKAIYDKDEDAFYEGFKNIMKMYKTFVASGTVFGPDETLGMWPIAIMNLARLKGMDVEVDLPLVPKELLVKEGGDLEN